MLCAGSGYGQLGLLSCPAEFARHELNSVQFAERRANLMYGRIVGSSSQWTSASQADVSGDAVGCPRFAETVASVGARWLVVGDKDTLLSGVRSANQRDRPTLLHGRRA